MNKDENISLHDIIKAIEDDNCLDYARSDMRSILDFNGRKMLDYLMNTIGNNYRNNHDRTMKVRSSVLKKIVSYKAYNILIELGGEWLQELHTKEQAIAVDLPEIRVTHHG